MSSYKLQVGLKGESIAQDYLSKKGIIPILSNYKSRYGEIDIIAQDENYIIFVEVKTRKKHAVVSGRESVSGKKQERIIKTACMFMQERCIKKQPRFDVIEIKNDYKGNCININHIESAFSMEGNYAFF